MCACVCILHVCTAGKQHALPMRKQASCTLVRNVQYEVGLSIDVHVGGCRVTGMQRFCLQVSTLPGKVSNHEAFNT